jgi:hypothetical protein
MSFVTTASVVVALPGSAMIAGVFFIKSAVI